MASITSISFTGKVMFVNTSTGNIPWELAYGQYPAVAVSGGGPAEKDINYVQLAFAYPGEGFPRQFQVNVRDVARGLQYPRPQNLIDAIHAAAGYVPVPVADITFSWDDTPVTGGLRVHHDNEVYPVVIEEPIP